MSIERFWSNVTSAARQLARPRAEKSGRGRNGKTAARTIERPNSWLTPDSVDGFDPAEYGFLPTAEREELADAVGRFLEVAGQVPLDGSATKPQVESGRRELQRILAVLDTDHFADADAFVIGKRLHTGLGTWLPPYVRDLRVETGFHADDDPAVWIYVIIADDAARDEVLSENTRNVRQLMDREWKRMDDSRWPSVRFRTVSEDAELAEERR
jgi:hypothetical protein